MSIVYIRTCCIYERTVYIIIFQNLVSPFPVAGAVAGAVAGVLHRVIIWQMPGQVLGIPEARAKNRTSNAGFKEETIFYDLLILRFRNEVSDIQDRKNRNCRV